ncbi:MAG: DUF4331 domain-containing protein [Verrucomicrobia bacterium]|nr:DUF4331 domain-containing protein [Verrucomicrobiota bacterium]
MKSITQTWAASFALTALLPLSTMASSHMDAPLVTLDPAANTTDVYAFVSMQNSIKYLTVALAVYPHEEPGIGPNKYNFDDNVLYRIRVATGTSLPTAAIPKPKTPPTQTYEFSFKTAYKNRNTIAQSYLGVINTVNDAAQNLTQSYTVKKIGSDNKSTVLFTNALVPPNNQGLTTPKYNQDNDGEKAAKEGVADAAGLDAYTAASIYTNTAGYQVFAGQRDDGFYADVQSIFDLDFSFTGGGKPFDSQGGYNVHTIVLNIPVSELGGDQRVAGVWAETSRQATTVLKNTALDTRSGLWIQVGRQGNPLFCEALLPGLVKDAYNRSPIGEDVERYKQYATAPELATILGVAPDRRVNRSDLAGIFIPDLIKVDLSTGPAKLAGGSNVGAAANDAGFHRLGIFGGDTLTSAIQPGFGGGTLAGGWPNGRRFGDDVVDIAVIAILSDLRTSPPMIFGDSTANVDGVQSNDIGYNKVFPYAATPQNGRNH